MPTLKNFVAIDWRAGPDRIYFFFKDTDTYTRFDIGDKTVPPEYPTSVEGNWGGFEQHVKNLRFGFTTTSLGLFDDQDTSWLFYYDGNTPMVCEYDQDLDAVAGKYKVVNSMWAPILPYFDQIVAGTWWQISGYPSLFRFLLNDGHYLSFNYATKKLTRSAITYNSMRGLEPYKDRIITAAQNDRTFADSYWYIFLTNNQFLIYNIQSGGVVGGLRNVNDATWPGLLRG
ncbi:hypothetical protein HCU66_10720 [Pseudomonas frederiksbergensis]|uniref:hypothetical protein n=1 Tax=Pseudomonas frederiksbergensis TaxID=104087 RepID=UPI0019817207|nr:hypothetical protein [Pseudomonas frederiksbergensis]MBN3862696.1 hypothetical protein [Pseudomonas frederiksbergensis]